MKLPLHQGSYQARSPIANAQSCINLYAEPNPKDAPFPVTHYPAPGLALLSDFTPLTGPDEFVRGIYVSSGGSVFACIGNTIIRWYGPGITVGTSFDVMGNMLSGMPVPVQMCDNGTTLVIVDGSSNGYTVPLPGTPGSMQAIGDPAFYGSVRVDFIDTFMVFNQPGTGNFYTTTSNIVTPFDPTYFAAKEGWNDLLACVACLHDNIWLFGNSTTEIWFNAGGQAFPFARMPNSVLQQGVVAPYSVVIADSSVYWLSQDRWGRNLFMRGEGYSAQRVSNFAVEDAWSKYPLLSDAVGMTYQFGGHQTIGLYFPSGNAWWAYDAATGMWHQRTYGDLDTPWLPYCMAGFGNFPYEGGGNMILAGDRSAPRILALHRDYYTDVGQPIWRQRSWLHVQDDGNRVYHGRFAAAMSGAGLYPDAVSLAWSDDAGQTFGAPVTQTVANQSNGQYLWNRLGYARDRVYQLTWTGAGECPLNGAWITTMPFAS
jgi:hypothetical protein